METNDSYPEAKAGNFLYDMARAGMGLFPGGAVGAELIRFFYSPLDDRRKEWLERLAEEMRRLKESDSNVIERLSKNPEFVSLLTSASIFAYKTHIKEKLDYLANSITNSIKSDLSYDVKQAYINFVDQLSIDHIKILEYARDYRDLNINAKLKSYKDFYRVLVKGSRGVPILSQMDITTFRFLMKDLESKGLIFISSSIGELSGEVYEATNIIAEDSGDKLPHIGTTTFGEKFIKFIKENNIEPTS